MANQSVPDAAISLHPDSYAPRAARYCVATVDRPSPDLRDVVVLLTSELVTRAVMLCESALDHFVEVRVWMPADVVRVELHGPRELLCAPPGSGHPLDDLLLVDGLADRWAIDLDDRDACIWFEIDRHAEGPGESPQPTERSRAPAPETAETREENGAQSSHHERRSRRDRSFTPMRRR